MPDEKIFDLGDGSYVIADQGGWLPGVYANKRAAQYALMLPELVLADAANEVNRGGRDITFTDLCRASAAFDEKRGKELPAIHDKMLGG